MHGSRGTPGCPCDVASDLSTFPDHSVCGLTPNCSLCPTSPSSAQISKSEFITLLHSHRNFLLPLLSTFPHLVLSQGQ